MEINTTNQINITCSKCGAAITNYNTNTTFAVCDYCGAETNLADGLEALFTADVNDDDKCIIFKTSEDEFKAKLLRWLIDADNVPVNILKGARFDLIKKQYCPIYTIKGTYDGTYSILNLVGKIQSENNSLHGEFSVTKYGGKDKPAPGDEKMLLSFAKNISDQQSLISIKKVNNMEVEIVEALHSTAAWDEDAKLKAAEFVYNELKKQDSGHKYKHYLKYEVKSVDVLYYPLWTTTYSFGNLSNIYVYMDEVSGEIIGDRPIDGTLKLSRGTVFKGTMFWAACIWFAYYILRVALGYYVSPKLALDTKFYHNILISNLFDTYWQLRGEILCLGIPLLMSLVLFGKLKTKYYNDLKVRRKSSLDNILSGQAKSIF